MSNNNLQTVANYAKAQDVTTSYIYKLIGDKRIYPERIDGVKFIDKAKYPKIADL